MEIEKLKRITKYTPKYARRYVYRHDLPLSDGDLPTGYMDVRMITASGRKCELREMSTNYYQVRVIDDGIKNPLAKKREGITEKRADEDFFKFCRSGKTQKDLVL